MAADRVIPHNIEAEEALIGACLLSPDSVASARQLVTPSDFYKPQHRTMFQAILDLTDAAEHVDVITVADSFPHDERDAAITELARLQNSTPSIGQSDVYANRVLHTSKLRTLIYVGSDLVDQGYQGTETPAEVADTFSHLLADHELLRRNQGGEIVGYYPDIGLLDTGEGRDEAQPWIARGVLRRRQRLMVVAKAGLGKSTFLRQLAFCAVNGVHPLTSQPTERPRRALIVEAEAGAWDISSSMRDILLALKRSCAVASAFDLARPALLHRPGGIDIRSPNGRAALELAIQRSEPELVVMGPVKYLFSVQPGENYETAALGVHGVLNTLLDRYGFALALEAHFSRGDHGAPGGSERWVDWPDVGFGIHPPDESPIPPPPGTVMEIRQFRSPRDADIYISPKMVRGSPRALPWIVDDHHDPVRAGKSVYSERYGGVREADFQPYRQPAFIDTNADL